MPGVFGGIIRPGISVAVAAFALALVSTAGASVCNMLRETVVGDTRLWKYLKIEARVGRPLSFAEQSQ
jgi:hypothetical protein